MDDKIDYSKEMIGESPICKEEPKLKRESFKEINFSQYPPVPKLPDFWERFGEYVDKNTPWYDKFFYNIDRMMDVSGKVIYIIYYLLKIIGYFNMNALKDWKTTIPAIIAGIFSILQVLGVVIPTDLATNIPVAICAIILLFTDWKKFLSEAKTLIPVILSTIFLILTTFHIIIMPAATFAIINGFIVTVIGLFTESTNTVIK